MCTTLWSMQGGNVLKVSHLPPASGSAPYNKVAHYIGSVAIILHIAAAPLVSG